MEKETELIRNTYNEMIKKIKVFVQLEQLFNFCTCPEKKELRIDDGFRIKFDVSLMAEFKRVESTIKPFSVLLINKKKCLEALDSEIHGRLWKFIKKTNPEMTLEELCISRGFNFSEASGFAADLVFLGYGVLVKNITKYSAYKPSANFDSKWFNNSFASHLKGLEITKLIKLISERRTLVEIMQATNIRFEVLLNITITSLIKKQLEEVSVYVTVSNPKKLTIEKVVTPVEFKALFKMFEGGVHFGNVHELSYLHGVAPRLLMKLAWKYPSIFLTVTV